MDKQRENQRQLLLEAARSASESPGVYLMKGSESEILYVGKAKCLKNRLISYFQPPIHEIPRTQMLVTRIDRFDVILTETEAEALILENTLIKRHKPKFNVRLKDDKTYPYLKIATGSTYPQLEWTRRVERDGARYFGPFPSAWAARQVMHLLNEAFQLRDCSDNTFKHRTRACILGEIGRCTAPCVGQISEEAYRARIEEVVAVLEGRGGKILDNLKAAMEEASDAEDFEEAAALRDQLQNLQVVTETQGIIEAGAIDRDRDVVGLAREPSGEAQGVLLKIRGGKLIGVRHFSFQNLDASLSDPEVMRELLSQYYFSQGSLDSLKIEGERAKSSGEAPPREILVPICPIDDELLSQSLGARILIPGAEDAVGQQLIEVARKNAAYSLRQGNRRSEHGHGAEALEEVMDKLHLTKFPGRIECFDNSNIQGEDAVASRVVFIDGAPDKNLYRRYKIRTVEGANDFATMREVLGRRFSHTDRVGDELPDLVVVDGGKGQLSQAVAIMEELAVQGVAVVGLAKARTESDFKSSEVKSTFERIFIPGRKNPINLYPTSKAYKLLVHIRDEAHRFAITYHRKVRSKRSLGEGPKS